MQNFIEFGNQKINYTIVRSNRKTVGISLSISYGVKVAAPRKISDKQIAEVVNSKAAWIIEKLSYLESIKSEVPQMKFIDGEKFSVLGKEYTLKVNINPAISLASVSTSDKYLIVSLPQNVCDSILDSKANLIRSHIINWYKNLAREVVSQRIDFFAKKLDVKPSNLIIKDLKSIWGSCTGRNAININWKIIIAPLDIVDYLVVHELTHIKIKNHSKHFWGMAESILPNYKECSKWLKINGHKLSF
ncbi:M48 family metallopeptidase [Acetivibrio cellulolyticus]|uniref:M48 family metallopeptidase n=1 Tax=Acetivibrio cellulolyticus TaxID=35830 RepID=UPI0001E2D443|nr:SprT family zinc-dependent metalloprotease [Acetivibrio cellulolyticus]